VAAWEHAGVAYYVHVGSEPRTAGHLTILALGPRAAYRSVVFGPDGADQVLRILLAAPDTATRSGAAECLLAIRGALVH
jgi:hypothetical protein